MKGLETQVIQPLQERRTCNTKDLTELKRAHQDSLKNFDTQLGLNFFNAKMSYVKFLGIKMSHRCEKELIGARITKGSIGLRAN